MVPKQILVLCAAAFPGGTVGGMLSTQLLSPRAVEAQKPNGVNAEEFLLLDTKGKARAGLGVGCERRSRARAQEQRRQPYPDPLS